MRKRTNTKSGEEKWFLAPGTHMNAFQVRMPLCVRRVQQLEHPLPRLLLHPWPASRIGDMP